jgi:hypothetical protein
MALYALHGELTIYEADRRAAIVGLYATVYDDDITLVHLGFDHRRATHTKEKRGGRVSYKEFHKVEFLAWFLIGRRRKSRTHLTQHIRLERSGGIYGIWFHKF